MTTKNSKTIKNKLVIHRDQWDAGHLVVEGGLLLHSNVESRLQCCLGHLGTFVGIPDKLLCDRELPSAYDVRRNNKKWPVALFEAIDQSNSSGDWEDALAQINDSVCVPREPDGIREQWLIEGFKQLFGIELEFVGEYLNEKDVVRTFSKVCGM